MAADEKEKYNDCSDIAIDLGIVSTPASNSYLNVNDIFDKIEDTNDMVSDIEMGVWEGGSNPSDSCDSDNNNKLCENKSVPSLDKDLSEAYKDIEYCKLTYDLSLIHI